MLIVPHVLKQLVLPQQLALNACLALSCQAPKTAERIAETISIGIPQSQLVFHALLASTTTLPHKNVYHALLIVPLVQEMPPMMPYCAMDVRQEFLTLNLLHVFRLATAHLTTVNRYQNVFNVLLQPTLIKLHCLAKHALTIVLLVQIVLVQLLVKAAVILMY